MVVKKRGLGKNLNALLVGTRNKEEIIENRQGVLELAINQLQPGRYQPRREFDATELETLAESIRVQGVIQPIIVRPIGRDKYEIIAGERRFRATQLAGLSTIPAIIKEVNDQNAMAMALIENLQREDLNPLEEALAFDRLSKEFGLTHVQVAEAVGKPRTSVTNSLRLLSLNDEVKILLEKGDLEVGHAKVLLALKGHQQNQVAETIVNKDLSVRETERLIGRLMNETEIFHRRKTVDPDVHRLQNTLSDKLGASVQILHNSQGKGKIIIHYNTLDELDGILSHLDPSFSNAL